jgi:hypothetical protein
MSALCIVCSLQATMHSMNDLPTQHTYADYILNTIYLYRVDLRFHVAIRLSNCYYALVIPNLTDRNSCNFDFVCDLLRHH